LNDNCLAFTPGGVVFEYIYIYKHTKLVGGIAMRCILAVVFVFVALFAATNVCAGEMSITTGIPSAGWIQTELNAGLGRSLYATDTEIFGATYNGVYSTIDNGMPWFSIGPTGPALSRWSSTDKPPEA
jgi:hypothetical protein